MSEKVIVKYNVLGDDLYYHHTKTETVDGGYRVLPDAHTQYEVLYLIDGELSYVIDGASYQVKKGDMIFVAPHEIHTLYVNGKLPYERMVLLFDMEILLVMMRKMGVTLGAFSYEKKNRFHVIEKSLVEKYGLGALLLQIIKSPEDGYKKLDIISKLINFVIAIDKLISDNTERFKKPDFCDNLVSLATEYIDANIDKPLDLDGIAKALLVSKSTLCHKFTSVMSVSVNRYTTMKKIYRGAELIRSGISTHDAARLVGYDAYTSFFYNYKKIIGLPPSAFTKDGRG